MGYKILLADDSVTLQKIITLTFADEGVDVVTVNNGDEAINRLQYLRPALVMADVSIPGRNGYEICEFVKTHPEMKDTPVILLVPAFEPFDEERARRIGADFHLTKPFQRIRDLISTVKNLAERKAGAEFLVADSGLTAVHDSDQNNTEPSVVDPKRAKIDELIRLSSQAPGANDAEDGVLPDVEPAKGEGSYSNTLTVASASDTVEVRGAARAAAAEGYSSRTSDAIAQDSRVSTEVLDLNMDNILELEDVLPDTAPAHAAVVGELTGVQPGANAEAFEKQVENQGFMVIPQSAIDEIVNRVSAQLADQLSEKLSEKLSGEIARRIAPEVAELVKRQLLAGPAAYRDPENLLDID
ncbi:MAG: PleD family two-component system response regulator [Blastocatellales bacterium]